MAGGSPRLSILMVNWNTREMTLACLRSVYAETHATDFEIVLVDNGSVDGSVDAIRAEFPQVRLIAEAANHGFGQGNNIAAAAAGGEFLLLLNTDTIILDRAIDRLMSFAERRPEAGIWGGRTVFADGRPNPTFAWGRITAWSAFCLATGLSALAPRSRLFNPEGVARWGAGTERPVDIVSGCFFLIRADLWRSLSGFDPAFFMYGEEADLCARARSHGARPHVTPNAMIVHHGGGSATKRTDTLVYLSGARIGLALRHLPPLAGRGARAMTLFAAWWRAQLFGIAAAVSRDQKRHAAAMQWRELWSRRSEWRDGPVARAL